MTEPTCQRRHCQRGVLFLHREHRHIGNDSGEPTLLLYQDRMLSIPRNVTKLSLKFQQQLAEGYLSFERHYLVWPGGRPVILIVKTRTRFLAQATSSRLDNPRTLLIRTQNLTRSSYTELAGSILHSLQDFLKMSTGQR